MSDDPTRQPDSEPTDRDVPGLVPEEPRAASPEIPETPPQGEPPAPDPEPESSPEPGPEPAASPPTPSAPPRDFDPSALPQTFWHIIKDPEAGLADAHAPGQAGLLSGLCIGGISILFLGIANKIHIAAFPLLKGWVGGVGFVVAGGLASLLLRATVGKVRELSWMDDFYLIGSALAYPLVAGVLATLIAFVPGLDTLAGFVGLLGCLLGAYAFKEGLVEVGRADERRAIWLAGISLAAGVSVGAALGFMPFVLA